MLLLEHIGDGYFPKWQYFARLCVKVCTIALFYCFEILTEWGEFRIAIYKYKTFRRGTYFETTQSKKRKHGKNIQHIRHVGLLQETDCVVPLAEGHVPPFDCAVVTINVCVKVPEPHVTEQLLVLLHPPTQLTAVEEKEIKIL